LCLRRQFHRGPAEFNLAFQQGGDGRFWDAEILEIDDVLGSKRERLLDGGDEINQNLFAQSALRELHDVLDRRRQFGWSSRSLGDCGRGGG
jgi:hypothetical protein